MELPSPIPESMAGLIAERFQVLGEPMRVRILDALRDGEASVGEIAARLGASQQNISKHLATIYANGVVSRRKDGNRVLYAIEDESVLDLCEHVCGSLERAQERRSALLSGAG